MFWTGSTVGFAVMAAVPENKTVYPLLGRSQDFLKHSSRLVDSISIPSSNLSLY